MQQLAPAGERERMVRRHDRERVDAVRADDRDRHDEEDDEPAERQAEQPRRREVEADPAAAAHAGVVRQLAFTSSHSLA